MCPDNDCPDVEACCQCEDCGYWIHSIHETPVRRVRLSIHNRTEVVNLCTPCAEEASAEDLAYEWADLSRKAAYE